MIDGKSQRGADVPDVIPMMDDDNVSVYNLFSKRCVKKQK